MFGFKKKMKLPDGSVITHEMLVPIDEYFAAVENELYNFLAAATKTKCSGISGAATTITCASGMPKAVNPRAFARAPSSQW
jgi:hypothetical protein